MFLRKLLGSNNEQKVEAGRSGPPAGMQTMGASLQRKFARGVQYNMKIIIKGDRNVGKTCLFYRLQGQKFKEEYIPTEEIQVASIQWNYKATDDVVKVEVWDVVDKGKKKKKLEGLKLENQDGLVPDMWAPGGVSKAPGTSDRSPQLIADDACLDAEFIDVYKGTHGVIMVMDITKQWTFDYIVREVDKVPRHVPILILANHRDMGHHRTVSEDTLKYYIEELDRGGDAAAVRYAETSMRNGFGLKYIHKFFNLPFLHLQRETLMRQLSTNMQELEATMEELDLHEESEEHNYELFLDSLTSKRREQQEKLAEKALAEARKAQEEAAKVAQEAAPSTGDSKTVENGVKPALTIREAPPPKPIKGLNLTSTAAPLAPGSSLKATTAAELQSPMTPVFTGTAPVTPSTPGATTPGKDDKQGFMSRWFGRKEKSPKLPDEMEAMSPNQDPVKSVEDFVPEEGLDASFLDDAKDIRTSKDTQLRDSDSEDEGVNPMVAGFQEDLDSDDEVTLPSNPPVSMTAIANEDISSDEDEKNNKGPVVRQDQDLDSDDAIDTPDYKTKPNTAHVTEKPLMPTQPTNNHKPPNNKPNSKVSKPAQVESAALSSLSESDSEKVPSPPPMSVSRNKKSSRLPMESFPRPNHSDNESEKTPSPPPVVVSRSKKKLSKPPTESFPRPNRSDDDSENEADHHVTILGDLDYSDGDDDIKHQPVITVETGHIDSGFATSDTTQENDGSQTSSEAKPSLGLEFEDLSIFEQGLTTPLPRVSSLGSDMAVSSSRADTDTDIDVSSSSKKKKKHKHKDKDKDKDKNEDGHRRSKHKKHKEKKEERDVQDCRENGSADKARSKDKVRSKDKEDKKKRHKKQEDSPDRGGLNELEAFLGSDLVEPSGGGAGYESL